jgi:phosphomannomutase
VIIICITFASPTLDLQTCPPCLRGPDPTSDKLTALISKTKNVGFAFDLDSDRVILVMNGEKKSSDITLGLGVVKAIKLGIKKFVLSVDSSLAVEKYIIKHGGQVWRSKVGEANVIQMMITNNAEAGGEGSSGGFILKKFNMCRDGLLTSGLIASMIDDEFIQEDVEFFESFSQIRNKVPVESSLHDKVITNMAKELETNYKIDQLDGIKININDNTWSLIRKSNTEDIIRVSTESNDKQLLEKIQNEMIKKVECCYEEIK